MADTQVEIRDELGKRMPSVRAVKMHSGDTVTFLAADGSETVLWFSPGAMAALHPAPGNSAKVAGSQKLTFTFADADSANAGVVLSAPDEPPSGGSLSSDAGVLSITPCNSQYSFPVPRGRTQG